MRLGALLSPAVLGVMLVMASSVRADSLRVALVGTPENLQQATHTVLAPWNIQVVDLPEDPALLDPGATQRAKELSLRHSARAVVWLARTIAPEEPRASTGQLAGLPSAPSLPALWLYDARTERVTTRPIPTPPPFTDPTAAAVALSIKTLLRNSRLLPEGNEEVIEPPAIEPMIENGKPGPGPVVLSTQTSTDPGQAIGLEARLAIHVGLGSLAPSPEPRLALTALWSPPRLFPRYSFGIEGSLGPGVTITRDPFSGDLADLVIGMSVRRSFVLTERFQITTALTGSLHRTRLEGVVATSDRHVDLHRNNPRASGHIAAESQLPSGVCLFVRIDAVWALDRQRYLVDGEPVLELSRVASEVGVGIRTLLDW